MCGAGRPAYGPPMRALGVIIGIAAATVLAAPAHAAPRADVSVTITAEGTDLSGTVRTPRPATCAADRTVVVLKVKGAVGGGDDERFASDTVGLSGGRYTWSTGNTGTEGRFYAKLKGTADCKPARSGVVRAQRED
jgi:hypothetical protein